MGFLDLTEAEVNRLAAGSRSVEFPSVLLQAIQRGLQPDPSGSRLEEDLADLALARRDLASALHQSLMADAEHGFEIRTREALQQPLQLGVFNDRFVVGRPQRLK